jgi:hypothetical protein
MSGWKKRTIMEIAKKSGFIDADWNYTTIIPYLEAFAELVREDERDKWMERTAILIRGEREACAKLCESMNKYMDDSEECARAIRARGQA